MSIQTSRPIPSPEELAKYNEIGPQVVDRILALAEHEQKHRHGISDRTVDSFNRRAWGGMICALLVALSGMGAAVYVTVTGTPVVGGLIATVDLVALTSVFLARKKPSTELARLPQKTE